VSKSIEKQANPKLTGYLSELNNLLISTEVEAISHAPATPRHPVVFVAGVPRSGVTLVMQWLAASGLFSYPSNLIARFYKAPYLGARIQRMLTDPELAVRGEVPLPGTTSDDFFISELGQTRGLFAPNSFYSFWDHIFGITQKNEFAIGKDKTIDVAYLRSELAAFESVLDRPLAFHAVKLYRRLNYLKHILPNVIILYVTRKPLYNMQSLYEARLKQSGKATAWFSWKIPEYNDLSGLSPYKQVAGQFHYMRSEMERQLADIPLAHYIPIEYETFCKSPERTWTELNKSFNHFGFTLHRDYTGPRQFVVHNRKRLDKVVLQRLAAAYFALSGKKISL